MLERTLKLHAVESIEIHPTGPFHFNGTMFDPSHFPSKDQLWKPGVLWQTLRVRRDTYGVKLREKGTIDEPRIDLTIFGKRGVNRGVIEHIVREVRRRYDLDSTGVPAFVYEYRFEKILGPAIARWRGMRPKSGYSPYEFLVITVMLQNTIVRRSVTMLQELFERYGTLLEFDGHQLWAFWEPEAIEQSTEEELRALGIGYRARILKRQASQFVSEDIVQERLWSLAKENLVRKLNEIYGVGPQSAGYMRFALFHDYDALDHISSWEGKIYSRILFGHSRATPKRILDFLQHRYPGYRSLALHYLMTDLFWRHKEENIGWLAKLIRL